MVAESARAGSGLQAGVEAGSVDIANRRDLDRCVFLEDAADERAASAEADDAELNFVVGSQYARVGCGGGG